MLYRRLYKQGYKDSLHIPSLTHGIWPDLIARLLYPHDAPKTVLADGMQAHHHAQTNYFASLAETPHHPSARCILFIALILHYMSGKFLIAIE